MALLAIDQGASKTAAAIADNDGRILSLGMADGACHFVAGLERSMQTIRDALAKALDAAGMGMKDIHKVVGGLAGANWPDEIEMLEKALAEMTGAQDVTVYNDCVPAMRAGTDKPDAIALCAGSGCNGAVLVGGQVKMVFNNFFEALDQGSGGLAHRAFEAVFRSHLGIYGPTSLTQKLLAYTGLEEMDQLILAYHRGRLEDKMIGLAAILFEEADSNDPVALNVVYEFGRSLSRYVCASIGKYNIDPARCDVVLTGGIFKNRNPLLVESVKTHIYREYSNVNIVSAKYEPVVGALLLAFDSDGVRESAAHAACKSSAETMDLMRRDRKKAGKKR